MFARKDLSALAGTLLLIIILFATLTQRMMIPNDGSESFIQRAEITSSNILHNLQDKFSHPTINRDKETPNLLTSSTDLDSTQIISSGRIRRGEKIKHFEKNDSDDNKRTNSFQKVSPLISKPQSLTKNPDLEQVSKELVSSVKRTMTSPGPGSDISPEHQTALLHCKNQSSCIVPELQLKIKLKVYLCSHPVKQGVRFYYLAREGLLLHPNVQVIPFSEIETADFIVYLPGSAPWHLTECSNSSYAKKLLVLDEFDGYTIFLPYNTREEAVAVYGKELRWYYQYFKRSFVSRKDGAFVAYPHLPRFDVFPLTYSIAEAYIQQQEFNRKREIEILCTLRGSKSMTTRLRVQTWVAEYATNRTVQNVISSQVNSDSRQTVSQGYFQQMFNSKIIVTVNPANWEGDFRLWESMSTGALIFVDPLFVPHPFPLLDKVHVIYYSNEDQADLWSKLDYYRDPENREEAERIAIQGYLHAMKYHRTVSMIDYILRTAHVKRALTKLNPVPVYAYTGQYLNREARRQEKEIARTKWPGKYDGGPADYVFI